MAKAPETGTPESEFEKTFGWRRAADFLKNIIRLERSYVRLEARNKELTARIDELQRAVDEHNGQLKAILSTMNSAISHSVEASAERIAMETISRILDVENKTQNKD